VEAVDARELAVGLVPRAEEGLLEDARGADQPVEGLRGARRRHEGADGDDRIDGADHEAALAVEEAHDALLVDAAEHRAPRGEVALVAAGRA
jgi:hypothetical protein